MGQDEIKEEIRKSLKTNANGNTIFQNLLDATKAVLIEKLVPIQAFLKKQEKSEINSQIYHLKELEKEQTTPKASRRKEIIKPREKINKIEIKNRKDY